LVLSLCTAPQATQLFALEDRIKNPKAWAASSLNDAAMALYGREKFSTIQKSDHIELIVPKAIVRDSENIPLAIRSDIKARTVALFQDTNLKSLMAVFHVNENSLINYEFNIRMEFKGTVFAVIEGVDGKLYYTREYIDILTLKCMSSGE
jgi:hypothetical protein